MKALLLILLTTAVTLSGMAQKVIRVDDLVELFDLETEAITPIASIADYFPSASNELYLWDISLDSASASCGLLYSNTFQSARDYSILRVNLFPPYEAELTPLGGDFLSSQVTFGDSKLNLAAGKVLRANDEFVEVYNLEGELLTNVTMPNPDADKRYEFTKATDSLYAILEDGARNNWVPFTISLDSTHGITAYRNFSARGVSGLERVPGKNAVYVRRGDTGALSMYDFSDAGTFSTIIPESGLSSDYTYSGLAELEDNKHLVFGTARFYPFTLWENGAETPYRWYTEFSYRATAAIIPFEIVPVSSTSQPIQTAFLVAPNPARDEITVQLSAGTAELSVVDPTGKVLLTKHMQGGVSSTFDASAYPAGIYAIRAISDDGTSTQPVMILHD